MAKIRVWAPKAHRVELTSNGRALSMIKDKADWWHINAPFVEHGADYAFCIDGKGPFLTRVHPGNQRGYMALRGGWIIPDLPGVMQAGSSFPWHQQSFMRHM